MSVEFPADIPAPRPYDAEPAGVVSPSAMYRAQVERLHALGFPFDPAVPTGIQFYVAFQRAMNALEDLRHQPMRDR